MYCRGLGLFGAPALPPLPPLVGRCLLLFFFNAFYLRHYVSCTQLTHTIASEAGSFRCTNSEHLRSAESRQFYQDTLVLYGQPGHRKALMYSAECWLVRKDSSFLFQTAAPPHGGHYNMQCAVQTSEELKMFPNLTLFVWSYLYEFDSGRDFLWRVHRSSLVMWIKGNMPTLLRRLVCLVTVWTGTTSEITQEATLAALYIKLSCRVIVTVQYFIYQSILFV